MVVREVPIDEVELSDERPIIKRWNVIAGLCQIHGYRHGAELGVSKGRFTAFLCSNMYDMRMIAVDLWEPQPFASGDGAQTYVGWDHNESLADFKAMCIQYFPRRVRILRMHTVEAAKLIPDESLDFVFVDALHTYEACKADIEAWWPKIRSGGMLSGHDYNHDKFPGVPKAVGETGRQTIILPDHVWVQFKK
jgi:hypothetical protein